MKASAAWLRGRTVRDLVAEKRKLVEVPYTATLSHTMNTLLANNVVAVPVAAPPGHWIGAGGSMILESDRVTGAVRKHYIGMVTMLDILSHIAEFDRGGAIGGRGEGSASLIAVPIIEASEPVDDNTLINGKGRKLISTFTSTDLRGCPTHLLQSWLSIGVEEFKERVSELQRTTAIITGDLNHRSKKLVTCYADTTLGEVIKEAIDWHMHRVWVVDQHGLLVGLVSLTDMLRVIREAALAEEGDDIA
ncbi:SNF1-related protein kinase regulatory subunit gamma-like PV42a [Acorus calamus]|uniref:SNF1-related protein kinase regulatory subunit gamma-like PV42a n=1 Tax=Acorus calamus TaxID=4465 RepID=A0AAV9CSZ0_ACOCL|nr:SNF1-related protein kinase regulatory subunit gamma-like PV42a [Acorus calamus]